MRSILSQAVHKVLRGSIYVCRGISGGIVLATHSRIPQADFCHLMFRLQVMASNEETQQQAHR